MPRDSHLLAPHTQQLLREARKPRFAKRKPEPTEEDKGDDEDEDEKQTQKGFQAKKWTQLPRHLEEPEQEFLAKRRKGLPNPYIPQASMITATVPTRKAKVRKLDANGNSTIYEVIVPEGQPVEGEVVDDDVTMTEAAPATIAPGTVVEGVGVANAQGLVIANNLLQPTPQRKRNRPPPRKSRGGPGRGRKKVKFIGTNGQPTSAAAPSGNATTTGNLSANGTATSDGAATAAGQDSSVVIGEVDDEEGEEGEDGEEDGDDDDDREEGELSDQEDTTAPPSAVLAPQDTVGNDENLQTSPLQDTADGALPLSSGAPQDVPDGSKPDSSLASQGLVDTMVSATLPDLTTETLTAEVAPQATQQPHLESGTADRDPSTSPDLPLAQSSHNKQDSTNVDHNIVAETALEEQPQVQTEVEAQSEAETTQELELEKESEAAAEAKAENEQAHTEVDDLLGKFERGLDEEDETSLR